MFKVDLSNSFSPDLAKTTHPSVIKGLVNVLASKGVECIIVDSPNTTYNQANLDEVYLDTGMLDVANSSKCKLNRDLKTFTYKYNDGVELKTVEMLEILNQVDAIVNVSKLKVDNNLGFCGGLHNIFGLIPGNRKDILLGRFEKLENFNNYLLDMYEIIKRKMVLSVIDGIVAEESDETQHLLGCLAISNNMFSLDNEMMSILGIKPSENYIAIAEKRGLFDHNSYTKIVGDKTKLNLENFNINNVNNKTVLNVPNKKYGCGKGMKRPEIDPNICKGCQICSKICPTGAITMEYDKNDELYAKIDYTKCIFCFKCVTGCPYKVVDIKTPKKYKKVDKQIAKQNELEGN